MSTVELQFDASTPVSLDGDLVATSCTLTVKEPDGTAHSTPTVTLPSVSTTIASGTTATVLTLASVSGISVGDVLHVVTDGQTYQVTAAIVDATAKTVTLLTGLPVTPETGDTVKNVKLTATVTAPGAANVGSNWRLVWEYSDGVTTTTESQPAAVVRQRWVSPIDASDVRDVLAELQTQRSEAWCQDVADRVDTSIRAKVEATGRRPWAYLSPISFVTAARLGIRYELAHRGIALGGAGSIYEAMRELRFAFDDSLSSVIGSLAYDKDADGAISGNEARPLHFSIQAVR